MEELTCLERIFLFHSYDETGNQGNLMNIFSNMLTHSLNSFNQRKAKAFGINVGYT